MPHTISLANTRSTLVSSRPSPSVGNAIRSQSLVNSRHRSSNAHASAPVPASPLPSRKSPKNHANPASDNPPNLSSNSRHTRQTLMRAPVPASPLPSRKSPKSCKSCFRQSAQSLVNSRHHSSNAHASAPVPASPLPSRKSPKIMQILLQTIRPISRKLSSSLVKRSCERTCANVAPSIPKIPKSCKSCFRQSPQSLVNSRHRSSNAHASAPVPASPLPSRKSPKIMQILLQTIQSAQSLVNSRHLSYKRSYEHS